MTRIFNFNPGPSALPLEILEEAAREMTDWRNTGMSILEISHRSAAYQEIHDETIELFRRLMNLPSDRSILFIQGGGSLQFAMVPANFHTNQRAAYMNTGVWAEKAMKEAAFYGDVYEAASSADRHHTYIPENLHLQPGTSYLHITSNNTIYGTEYRQFPHVPVPLFCDMSSDILSRPVPAGQFDLIYAGIQKNLGPAGAAVVIIKNSLLENARRDIPLILRYRTFAEHDSLYNTPPVFCIYMMNKMLRWIEQQGGACAMEEQALRKSSLIYRIIDESGGFYRGHAEKESRSRMNITFNLASPDMEKDFIHQAACRGLSGLGGHRLVGGCRVSLYNAVPAKACRALALFMKDYQEKNRGGI